MGIIGSYSHKPARESGRDRSEAVNFAA